MTADPADARLRTVPFMVGSAAALAGAIALDLVRETRYGHPNAPVPPALSLRSGPVLKRLVLSFDALAADVYWIRAVQHFGDEHRTGSNRGYPLLFPLLDLTTTLDPQFNIAYRFGAIFLAEPRPGGAGRPDLAIDLLKKGIAAEPRRWEYYQDIGFVQYWQLHDYKAAAEWYERGSRVEGAPWWLRSLAAVMLARGGDRQASRFMWQKIRETADNAWLRDQADLRLAQIAALDELDELSALVNEYRSQMGRTPDSWEALRRAGLLRGDPVDPAGAPYVLDPVHGTVSLAADSKLRPLPAEPPGRPVS